MKSYQKVISFILIMALLVVTLSPPPEAQADTSVGLNQMDQRNQILQDIEVIEDPAVIEETNDLLREAITNGKIVPNSSSDNFNYDKANVGVMNAEGQDYTILSIPIVSEKFSPISSFGVVIQNGEILTSNEFLAFESGHDTFEVEVYTDGQLVKQEITDIEYFSNKEVQQSLDGIQSLDTNDGLIETQSIGKTAACLAIILAIDLALARIVAAFCIGVCGTGIIPLCAPCILGTFGLAGTNIVGVIACFNA